MNKKLIALLAAAVLTLGGVVSIVLYARSADARAFAGAEMTTVLVVTSEVPAGSPAERLVGSVEKRQLPRTAVADGALADITSVKGKVTNAALMPGEQVLEARFGRQVEKKVDESAVPKGLQEMQLQLPRPRVPSGLSSGGTVGVIASYGDPKGNAGFTRMTINGVRVIALDDVKAAESQEAQAAVGVRLTLAVTTAQAQEIANAAEFGKIWLTVQTDETDTNGAKRISSQDVLR